MPLAFGFGEYAREILVLQIDRCITAEDVVDTLAELSAMQGMPDAIRSDKRSGVRGWSESLAAARRPKVAWKEDHNHERPQRLLGCVTPVEFAVRGGCATPIFINVGTGI